MQRRARSEESNKDSFYGICAFKVPKLHCNNQPPENTAFDIQESSSSVVLRWCRVQWKCPSSTVAEIQHFHCCTYPKIIHSSKVCIYLFKSRSLLQSVCVCSAFLHIYAHVEKMLMPSDGSVVSYSPPCSSVSALRMKVSFNHR